jgi:hypothetical protein
MEFEGKKYKLAFPLKKIKLQPKVFNLNIQVEVDPETGEQQELQRLVTRTANDFKEAQPSHLQTQTAL